MCIRDRLHPASDAAIRTLNVNANIFFFILSPHIFLSPGRLLPTYFNVISYFFFVEKVFHTYFTFVFTKAAKAAARTAL